MSSLKTALKASFINWDTTRREVIGLVARYWNQFSSPSMVKAANSHQAEREANPQPQTQTTNTLNRYTCHKDSWRHRPGETQQLHHSNAEVHHSHN